MLPIQEIIIFLNQIDRTDDELVGNLGVHLGDLVKANINIIPGFVVTINSWNLFFKENSLRLKISSLLSSINYQSDSSIDQVSKLIKKEIQSQVFPQIVAVPIFKAYEKLSGSVKNCEMSMDFSFNDTKLKILQSSQLLKPFTNIYGEANLIEKIKESYCLFFHPIMLRLLRSHKISPLSFAVPLIVQKNISADSSGVILTEDFLGHSKNKMIIEAIYGDIGLLNKGDVITDYYEIEKDSLQITTKRVEKQEKKLIFLNHQEKIAHVETAYQLNPKISDKQIIEVGVLGKKLQQHLYFPQIAKWAFCKNQLFLLNTKNLNQTGSSKKEDEMAPLLIGTPHGVGIIKGPVRIIENKNDIQKINTNEVVITKRIDYKNLNDFKKAKAIISDLDFPKDQAVEFLKLGIPVISNTQNASEVFKEGQVVTVHAERGEVYKGSAKLFEKINSLQTTATKTFVKLEELNELKSADVLYSDGVGLLCGEMFFNKHSIHPKKMVNKQINKLIKNELIFELNKLSTNLNNKPLFYKLSEFTSDKLRNFSYGKTFEEIEKNPFLGYRGLYRSLYDKETLKIELECIAKVRKNNKIKNLNLLVPFVRDISEFIELKKLLKSYGLSKSTTFSIWLFAQLPANVAELEEYINAGISGVNFDLKTLTTLMYGIDPQNQEMSSFVSTQNKALEWLIFNGIKTAQKYNIKTSYTITGFVNSSEFLNHMVEYGINSITVSPDDLSHAKNQIKRIESIILEKNDNYKIN